MKITSIEIGQLNQFNALKLDLTYPAGHPKRGKPLDKVCLIGQSGTGKSTILKLIQLVLNPQNSLVIEEPYRQFSINMLYNGSSIKTIIREDGRIFYTSHIENRTRNITLSELTKKEDTVLINIPADFASEANDEVKIDYLPGETNIYDFNKISVNKIWDRILISVRRHRESIKKLKQEIAEANKISDLSSDEMKALTMPLYDKLGQLEAVDNNPLKILAENCLDNILAAFGLRVRTEFSVNEEEENLSFLQIEDVRGMLIPNSYLSTGTKQFIVSSLPFHLLNPKNAVILLDEPERSLYPDVQKKLVSHFERFANNCQFFFATHSPIVASCFDPWEVIELKFNGEGHVYQEKYYTGERHVDNYHTHPKYLTYDLILRNVFDLDETEGEEREKMLTKLVGLEDKLNRFKDKKDNSSDEFNKTLEEYLKISKLLSWPENKSNA